jgi:hypothetical protein
MARAAGGCRCYLSAFNAHPAGNEVATDGRQAQLLQVLELVATLELLHGRSNRHMKLCNNERKTTRD